MPRLSVWSLRAALIYLAMGFTFGALLLANKGQPYWPQAWSTLPAHIELLLVGWMGQLALGVAYWILPRLQRGSRGNEKLALISIVLLNTGTLLVSLQTLFPVLLLPGRACEMLSAVLFAAHAWPRIKQLFP